MKNIKFLLLALLLSVSSILVKAQDEMTFEQIGKPALVFTKK